MGLGAWGRWSTTSRISNSRDAAAGRFVVQQPRRFPIRRAGLAGRLVVQQLRCFPVCSGSPAELAGKTYFLARSGPGPPGSAFCQLSRIMWPAEGHVRPSSSSGMRILPRGGGAFQGQELANRRGNSSELLGYYRTSLRDERPLRLAYNNEGRCPLAMSPGSLEPAFHVSLPGSSIGQFCFATPG